MENVESKPQVKQSRVGRKAVSIPQGVEATIHGSSIKVKGPVGELSRDFKGLVDFRKTDNSISVLVGPESGKEGPAYQGLARSLLQNMVHGVSKGFRTWLDLYGVGYRAEVKSGSLLMTLGLSHQVSVSVPSSVKVRIESIDEGGTKRPRVHVESCDKEQLGEFASLVRSFRPPEPYKGKGVRVQGERIVQKVGKAGGKGGK